MSVAQPVGTTSVFAAAAGTAPTDTRPPEEILASIQPKPWRMASASQITTFRRCPRRWWFRSVGKLEEPTRPSAQLGTDVHAVIERYTRDGVTPGGDEAGAIASAALHHLPLPGTVPADRVEAAFCLRGSADLPLARPIIGKIDRIDLPTPLSPGVYMPGRVVDYKTLSDFRYMRTAEDLQQDVQAIVYGTVSAEYFAGRKLPALRLGDSLFHGYVVQPGWLRHVRFQHLYLRTTKPYKSDTCQTVLTPDGLLAGLRGIASSLDAMAEVSRIALPGEVAGNLEACGYYGGCPRRDLCAHLAGAGSIFGRAAAAAMPSTSITGDTMTTPSNPFLRPAPAAPAPPAAPLAGEALKDALNASQPAQTAPAPAPAPAQTSPAPAAPAPAAPVASGVRAEVRTHAQQWKAAGHDRRAVLEGLLTWVANMHHEMHIPGAEIVAIVDEVYGPATPAAAVPSPAVAVPSPAVAAPVPTNVPQPAAPPAAPSPAPMAPPAAPAAAAGPASPVPGGLINPPDGTPMDDPAVAQEGEDDKKGSARDPRLPDHEILGKWRNERLPGIRKDSALECVVELRAKLDPAQKAYYLGASKLPAKGQTRAELLEDAQLIASILVGGEVGGGAGPVPAAPSVPTPPAVQAPAQPAPAVQAPAAPAQLAVQAPAPAAPPQPAAPPAAPPAPLPRTGNDLDNTAAIGGTVIYLDCHPRRTAVTYLHEVLAPYADAVARELQVPHYSLPDYKKGERGVLGYLQRDLDAGTLRLPAHLVIDRRLPLGDAAAEILLPRAALVVERIGG